VPRDVGGSESGVSIKYVRLSLASAHEDLEILVLSILVIEAYDVSGTVLICSCSELVGEVCMLRRGGAILQCL
jgi:hypothetical protein